VRTVCLNERLCTYARSYIRQEYPYSFKGNLLFISILGHPDRRRRGRLHRCVGGSANPNTAHKSVRSREHVMRFAQPFPSFFPNDQRQKLRLPRKGENIQLSHEKMNQARNPLIRQNMKTPNREVRLSTNQDMQRRSVERGDYKGVEHSSDAQGAERKGSNVMK